MFRIVDLTLDPFFELPPKPQGDGVDYENIAWNVYAGKGFGFDWLDPEWRRPYLAVDGGETYKVQLDRESGFGWTTARPPLYPYLIAAVYSVFERGPHAWICIRILNGLCLSVAGACSVYLSLVILRRLDLNPWSSILGGFATFLLACSDRTTATYASDFLTEPLALMLTQLFVVAIFVFHHSMSQTDSKVTRSSWQSSWIVIGVLLSAMVYARSIMIFMLPGIGLFLYWSFRAWGTCASSDQDSWRDSWRWSGKAILLAILLLSPWWVRNCIVLDRWMPLGTQGPITLLGAYCDESLVAGGEWQAKPELKLREEYSAKAEFKGMANDVEREVHLAEVASERVRAWIAGHWAELPRLGVHRALNLWSPFSGRSLLWKGLMLLGGIGLIVGRRPEAIWMLGLPLLTTIVVMLLYSTGSRFLVPCYGLLYALGGLGMASLSSWSIALLRRRFGIHSHV